MTDLEISSRGSELKIKFEDKRVSKCTHYLTDGRVKEYPYPYSERFIRSFYEKYGSAALVEDAERTGFVQFRHKYMISRFLTSRINEKVSILDFGCGTGISTFTLFQQFPNAEITAAEIVSDWLVQLKNRFLDESASRINTILLSDDGQLREIDQKFDIIWLNAVFEHLTAEERSTIMSKLWDSLNAGGMLVISETPWRWFPIETHTLAWPFVNYLPDTLSLLAYRLKRQGRKGLISSELTWKNAQRSGIRGGTISEIIRYTSAPRDTIEVMNSQSDDSADILETWWHGEFRKTQIKWATYRVLSLFRNLTGYVVSPWLNIVLKKSADAADPDGAISTTTAHAR